MWTLPGLVDPQATSGGSREAREHRHGSTCGANAVDSVQAGHAGGGPEPGLGGMKISAGRASDGASVIGWMRNSRIGDEGPGRAWPGSGRGLYRRGSSRRRSAPFRLCTDDAARRCVMTPPRMFVTVTNRAMLVPAPRTGGDLRRVSGTNGARTTCCTADGGRAGVPSVMATTTHAPPSTVTTTHAPPDGALAVVPPASGTILGRRMPAAGTGVAVVPATVTASRA